MLSQLYPLEADVSTILGGIAPMILGLLLHKPGRGVTAFHLRLCLTIGMSHVFLQFMFHEMTQLAVQPS